MIFWISASSAFDVMASPSWLPFWEKFEFLSILGVIVACWGEGWTDHKKFPDEFASPRPIKLQKDVWMKRFWRLLLVSLACEMVGFVFSFLGSNHEIEGLRNANDALDSQIVVAKSNLAALQLQVKWRTITPDQEAALIKALKPFADSLPLTQKGISINAYETDSEAVWYAHKIAEVLKHCGFEPGLFSRMGPWDVNPIPTGVQFLVKNMFHLPVSAGPIWADFQTNGLPINAGFATEQGIKLDDDTLEIFVGHKPAQ
jgi:hypothetical protein